MRATLAQTVPLGDLRAAGWTISRLDARRERLGDDHAVACRSSTSAISRRRVLDLAGPHGILQNPTVTHDRGWFGSRDALSIVVDVRSPSVDIVHDAPLAARLRAAGVDPALLEAQLAVRARSRRCTCRWSMHLPGGHTEAYDAAPGSVKAVRVADGGTDWDRVVKFGIGLLLALLAATVLPRRGRRASGATGAGPPQRLLAGSSSDRPPRLLIA